MKFNSVVQSPTDPDVLVAEFGPARFVSKLSGNNNKEVLQSHQIADFDYTRFSSDIMALRVINGLKYDSKKDGAPPIDEALKEQLNTLNDIIYYAQPGEERDIFKSDAANLINEHQEKIGAVSKSVQEDVVAFLKLHKAEQDVKTGKASFNSFPKASDPKNEGLVENFKGSSITKSLETEQEIALYTFKPNPFL